MCGIDLLLAAGYCQFFFTEKPVICLDSCYSDLRGKETKRVPIVRIFGANANGQKCLMHVHGVFPYFYIPHDKKKILKHLDMAIDISLGQGSSNLQHAFKIPNVIKNIESMR